MALKQSAAGFNRKTLYVSKKSSILANQNIMLMDSAEASVDCVTPYAIRNLTNYPLLVASLQSGMQ